tara:strand:+ start:126 stop:329 length:204 start_codon:yes stop_codon:yes gene_type:complete
VEVGDIIYNSSIEAYGMITKVLPWNHQLAASGFGGYWFEIYRFDDSTNVVERYELSDLKKVDKLMTK